MTTRVALVRGLGPQRKTGLFLWSFLAALALAVLLHPLWLTALAEFLVASSPLEPADVIVVLGGGGPDRVERGMELYRQGFSRSGKIVFTGGDWENEFFPGVTSAGLAARYAIERGIRPEDILLADWTQSTYDDAVAVRDLVKERGYSSAIVVSDLFHMRRAIYIMGRVTPGVRFMSSPASSPRFKIERWWTRESGLMPVVTEYIKLAFYLVRYGP